MLLKRLLFALSLISVMLLSVPLSKADPQPPLHPNQICDIPQNGALNMVKITCLAEQAGWGGTRSKIAAAIAMAESEGRPWVNSFDGGYGKGLYQIDTRYWKIDDNCAKDAWCNTLYAKIKVYRKQGWNAWATYTHRQEGQYPYCHHLGKDFIKKYQRRCL